MSWIDQMMEEYEQGTGEFSATYKRKTIDEDNSFDESTLNVLRKILNESLKIFDAVDNLELYVGKHTELIDHSWDSSSTIGGSRDPDEWFYNTRKKLDETSKKLKRLAWYNHDIVTGLIQSYVDESKFSLTWDNDGDGDLCLIDDIIERAWDD